MKKQIIFLIAWDAAFYIFLYMMSGVDNIADKAYYRMGNPYLFFFIPVISRVAVGALIGWLVLTTAKHEKTVKSAVLEFIFVGRTGFLSCNASYFLLLTACYHELPARSRMDPYGPKSDRYNNGKRSLRL